MADDSTPDVADIYAKGGELFALIGGLMVPLRPTAEAWECHKAIAKAAGWDDQAPPKRQSTAAPTTAAPEADPKLLARRRAANEALQTAEEACERFDSILSLRASFGVEAHELPGSPNYEVGRDRFLHQLARTL